MSHRDISEVEPEGTSALAAGSRALFLETVRRSNAACQNGDYAQAATLYTEALALDPLSHVLYSNRSAARLKMGLFALALQDAVRATELVPQWPKAYYRQGVALQCLGRHGEALVAFSAGLARDPPNSQLLSGLVEASLKSPLRPTLEPTFQQLRAMKLDESPFVVISVVGQELLGAGQYKAAAGVLEAALSIGTCSLKLRGSVFSALSSAYWALNSLDKAISYMQQDLGVARSLGDTQGECRAHGNLGSAYFSKGTFKEALTAHRYQLVLAMKCKDAQAAASALTSLGHVYTAIGDLPNALASHKQCVQLVKQMGDRLQEAREIGNVGAVYLAMGEFESAVDCHTQHLRIARRLGDRVEEARAFSNLGSSHHYRRNFGQAMTYHENVLRIAQELGDRAIETRAYAGLGHAARCAGDLAQAKLWHQRQLDVALTTKDKVAEGRACSNLGIVYQLLGEHDAALKLHQAHLGIARSLGDRAGMGRAYGNIGNAYNALGYYEQAIKYHKQELTISKEVNDRSSEASTHGNLAVAYQAVQGHETALRHYRAHLAIARELKDAAGEACALLNLANCLSSRGRFEEAVPYYENYLMLSQELHDVEGEAKACHFLGYAHYCLGNHREAVRYYDQDLALAKDLQDKSGMGRAYCNLGLAHLALGNLDTALECQKYYLAIAHMTKHLAGKFRALGNIGDCLLRLGEVDEAIKMHQRQLNLARQATDRGLEAAAYGALGIAHRATRNFDKALGFHTQELTLRQEEGDLRGECRAHGNLGAVHMALGQYTHAVKCYQEQLERSRELGDSGVEAQALGNLGIARLNMAHYEDAIGYFEQQLATLEPLTTATALLDKARALGNLGDCYEALGDPEEAIKCHEQQLSAAVRLRSVRDQERAYRGLGRAREASGNLPEALVCFEKRLVAAHEVDSSEARGAAYGDLGRVHAALGNHEQAVSCLSHQLTLARGLGDRAAEAEAASGLGAVHLLMDDPDSALRHHQLELTIAEDLDAAGLQARACANLGATQEALGQLEEAIRLQEQSLSLAAAAGDQPARAAAFSSLGRLHHLRGDRARALSYLQSGLSLSEGLGRREEVARLRHRLGLVHWQAGEATISVEQLEKAANLLESLEGTSANFTHGQPSKLELLTETYITLQKVLVSLNRAEEALNWAERSRRTRTSCVEDATHYSEIVDRQRGTILYYSETDDELHAWCLAPSRGLLRFHSAKLELDGTKLEEKVLQAREALLGENCNSDLDEPTTITARGHHLNASSYSLSSLFSVGSVSSRAGSARWGRGTKGPTWQAPQPLQTLYDLLLAPFEDLLPPARKELILVVEKSLYLAPLPALQASPGEDYLCERFSLLVVPSLAALKKRSRTPMPEGGATVAALVAGNPALPEELRDENDWPESSMSAETEANIVAELLESRPLVANEATRSAVLRSLPDAECVHLTTPILWNSGNLAFSPDQTEDGNERLEFLLSSMEISRLRLTARLVVLSSGHCWANGDNSGKLTSDGVQTVAKSFLNAGAQCVLVSMWPVPSTAGSILLRAFYSAMLQGARASRALAEAMQTVQHTRHFAHPANWAGWLLLGGDARLSNKVALMGQALAELLRGGPEQSRDALRVTLHLVEKSLQRIHRGQKNAMYTTQRSIENKVGTAPGWKELLMSVGFRFEPAGNGIPSSVFFPQSDPEERLTRCSASLQALLGLGPASLHALVRLLQAPEATEDVISAMRRATCATEGQEIVLPVKTWRASGSHELFASLGFDLMEVGQSEVTLRTGKAASRRAVQFALQALLALFDTQEAPKSLNLDSSSSMESLTSVTQQEPKVQERPKLGGAFASYVRHRGEPDGKTTEAPSLPISRQACPNGGGESDAAFTPSPPIALNLNHQTRIRTLYPDQSVRPGSSSSSSVTDWETGHATVLRRQPMPALPATVLERLSVRTEVGTSSPRKPRHPAANEDVNHQPEATQTTEGIPHNLRNFATSLTSLTRELTPTISEVYHERNLGLGLAPSLSKLLEEAGNVTESEQGQLTSTGNSQTQNWLQNEPELCRRDEADGRSIAESQCSATSSNKIHRKAPPPPV
ncbi:tetratricopeptide repeat protein 28 [Venturia canescens]|uniref:tetratricopeptide repeat protein 28 n=1 Tax=Venturia canescens TaxID=32260 RepID=UPI001C9BDFD3|nr:tetratricopeptide repeat protein 28 [Venturia canescens]XP_043288496.1 tetratricopeptide repeat protein 28 [Venturia canescens]XP_043288502.1 tetratricopeptide repeat protein 28 [Venturia canescens]